MHAEMEYSPMWLSLFEDLTRFDEISISAEYPVMVEDRYIMNPSPIPRFDNHKLEDSETLYLFGAGREKKIYAIPPHTKVESLCFEDVPFKKEDFTGKKCRKCGAENVYLDEMIDEKTGVKSYECNDSGFCKKRREYLRNGR
jgi:alpha-D-ribose 1-methylphosphonate 5-phosphate C-P lyase